LYTLNSESVVAADVGGGGTAAAAAAAAVSVAVGVGSVLENASGASGAVDARVGGGDAAAGFLLLGVDIGQVRHGVNGREWERYGFLGPIPP